MSFHGFITHLFLTLNHIPLSICSSLFIRLPAKGRIGLFQVLVIMKQSCYKHWCAGFCGSISFQLSWANNKEFDCLTER